MNNIVKLIEHSIKRGCWGVKAYENEYGQIFLNDIELFLIKQFESVSKDRADLYKGGFEIGGFVCTNTFRVKIPSLGKKGSGNEPGGSINEFLLSS